MVAPIRPGRRSPIHPAHPGAGESRPDGLPLPRRGRPSLARPGPRQDAADLRLVGAAQRRATRLRRAGCRDPPAAARCPGRRPSRKTGSPPLPRWSSPPCRPSSGWRRPGSRLMSPRGRALRDEAAATLATLDAELASRPARRQCRFARAADQPLCRVSASPSRTCRRRRCARSSTSIRPST